MISSKLKGFPFLIAHADMYPLEYLQMPTETKNALHQYGIDNVEDLIHFIGRFQVAECPQALGTLDALAAVSTPTGPDWYAYWETREFEFHDMCLTCQELEAFDKDTPVCAVDRESFGNAGAMLAQAGYETLGKLAEGLRSGITEVSGISETERADFFRRLVELVQGLREGQLSTELLALRFPICVNGGSEGGNSAKQKATCEIHEQILNLGIGILHAGTKTKTLRNAGYHSVGDVLAVGSETLLALPGMGRSTVSKIEKSLQSLQEAHYNFYLATYF